MMKKHRLIATAGASGLMLTLAACGGQGGATSGPETVRLSSYLQQDTAIAQAIDTWADETEECADGQIEFERFYNGALFTATDTRDAIANGRAEVGNFSPGYHPGEYPLTEGLLSVPFVAKNVPAVMDAFRHLYETKPEAQAEWNDQGLHMVSLIAASPGALGTNVPVDTIDDLNGLDIRGYSGGGLNAGLQAVGANPVDLEMAELPESMQRGVIDGFIGLIIDGATSLSLHESTDYFTETEFGISGASALAVNKDWWDGLPDDIRNCASEAAAGLNEPYLEAVEEAEMEACDVLREAGAELSALPEAETSKWQSLVEEDLMNSWIDNAEGAVDDPQAYFDDYEAALRDAEGEYSGLVFGVKRCLEG